MKTKLSTRFDLTDKVAWVVGGGGYLGTPICLALAEHGAHVIVADVQKQAAEKACGLLAGKDLSAEAMTLDITDEDAVKLTADTIITHNGHLDIVVNTTVYSTGRPMEQMSLSDWEKGSLCNSHHSWLSLILPV